MTDPSIFNQLLIWPILNMLISFYKGFEYLHIPGAFGWAIIALTIAIRIFLHPLTVKQLQSQKKISALKPHLDAISAKHKDAKSRLQQEQLKLYQEAGVNPAAGCLPLLLQFPVLIALYNVFLQVLSVGDMKELVANINKVVYFPQLRLESLDLNFFGIPLGVKPDQWQQYGVWLLLIPVLTAVLQWYQTKIMMPSIAPEAKKDETKPGKKEVKKELSTSDEMQKALQMQMKYFFPVFIGYLGYTFPVGLSLYWNVFSASGIIQQLLVNKAHEKEELLLKDKKNLKIKKK